MVLFPQASLPWLLGCECRNEARAGGARQYAAVYLQVRAEEMEAGMRQHWNCPSNLKAWVARQAGAGNTAATGML